MSPEVAKLLNKYHCARRGIWMLNHNHAVEEGLGHGQTRGRENDLAGGVGKKLDREIRTNCGIGGVYACRQQRTTR